MVTTGRTSVAATDVVAEPDGRQPTRIAAATEGQTIDGPAASPDGAAVAWAVLSERDGRLVSQLFVRPTAGTDAGVAVTDGSTLDLMPAFAPDGQRLLFASDQAGPNRLGVYEAGIGPSAAATAAAPGEVAGVELWPTLDTSPSPRMYVEARPPDRPLSRLVAVSVATGKRMDLGHPGAQPRVSPRADAVAFVRADPATGRRDLYLLRLGVSGAEPVNLTNTPDADEWDPAWSKTGSRIAFASDRPNAAAPLPTPGAPAAVRAGDANLWVLRTARPADVVQVTAGGAWDDSPSWSGGDDALYFRSSRGGEWGIWAVELPSSNRRR